MSFQSLESENRKSNEMKSRLMVGVLAALALVTAGCFKSKTLVVVNPDGSGNIVVSSAMSPQVAAMMGGLGDSFGAALGGDGAAKAEKKDPFFDEAKLKKAASGFGEGVTYVKGRKSDDNGWQGSVAVYAFTDINKVKLSLESSNMGPPGMENEAEDDSKKKKDPVTFEFAAGGTKTLKINIPQPDDAAKKKPAGEAAPKADPAAAAMMDAMLPQFKGMEMSVGIQIKGEITGSNAMNKDDKGMITLMHMDMDKMMTSPKFKEMMAASQGGEEPPPEEMLGMPGVKVETNKVVTITFK